MAAIQSMNRIATAVSLPFRCPTCPLLWKWMRCWMEEIEDDWQGGLVESYICANIIPSRIYTTINKQRKGNIQVTNAQFMQTWPEQYPISNKDLRVGSRLVTRLSYRPSPQPSPRASRHLRRRASEAAAAAAGLVDSRGSSDGHHKLQIVFCREFMILWWCALSGIESRYRYLLYIFMVKVDEAKR